MSESQAASATALKRTLFNGTPPVATSKANIFTEIKYRRTC